MEQQKAFPLLRYPGGKRRMLKFINQFIPPIDRIQGDYIEPFLGGGAVYFSLLPPRSRLSDVNPELIELYLGIQVNPTAVWNTFKELPSDKAGYYSVRAENPQNLDLFQRAARTMYLNRTCFKGMWRHNARGEFNVGYGGESRRWVLDLADLVTISDALKTATITCADFETVINKSAEQDFLFIDPPYRPGEREMKHAHYAGLQFTFEDHQRLAFELMKAAERGTRWCLTISSHPDLLSLYKGFRMMAAPIGTGHKIGIAVTQPSEVAITSEYVENM